MMHLNPASTLPPVDCPLLIQVCGQLLRAKRVNFVESKDHALDYLVDLPYGSQEVISGRYEWTYP